jgi:hypothetical protein
VRHRRKVFCEHAPCTQYTEHHQNSLPLLVWTGRSQGRKGCNDASQKRNHNRQEQDVNQGTLVRGIEGSCFVSTHLVPNTQNTTRTVHGWLLVWTGRSGSFCYTSNQPGKTPQCTPFAEGNFMLSRQQAFTSMTTQDECRGNG